VDYVEADYHGADEVPDEWDWRAVWRKRSQDPYLREAVVLEPDLLKVIELARRSRWVRSYHRLRRYYDLKVLIEVLVGWEA
jgi:hypothetical protein